MDKKSISFEGMVERTALPHFTLSPAIIAGVKTHLLEQVRTLKNTAAHRLPRSSQLSEALARALGFRTHAALLAAIKQGVSKVDTFSEDAFLGYLTSKGTAMPKGSLLIAWNDARAEIFKKAVTAALRSDPDVIMIGDVPPLFATSDLSQMKAAFEKNPEIADAIIANTNVKLFLQMEQSTSAKQTLAQRLQTMPLDTQQRALLSKGAANLSEDESATVNALLDSATAHLTEVAQKIRTTAPDWTDLPRLTPEQRAGLLDLMHDSHPQRAAEENNDPRLFIVFDIEKQKELWELTREDNRNSIKPSLTPNAPIQTADPFFAGYDHDDDPPEFMIHGCRSIPVGGHDPEATKAWANPDIVCDLAIAAAKLRAERGFAWDYFENVWRRAKDIDLEADYSQATKQARAERFVTAIHETAPSADIKENCPFFFGHDPQEKEPAYVVLGAFSFPVNGPDYARKKLYADPKAVMDLCIDAAKSRARRGYAWVNGSWQRVR
jgi:hypothetical protein